MARLYIAKYVVTFFSTARTTTATQITINACADPTSATYESNHAPIAPGISDVVLSKVDELASAVAVSPLNKMRKKGTTLKKENRDSTAPKALSNALEIKFQRYAPISGSKALSLFKLRC